MKFPQGIKAEKTGFFSKKFFKKTDPEGIRTQ